MATHTHLKEIKSHNAKITVGKATNLSCIDKLISQTLGNRLDVSEGGVPGSGTQQPDGLVHTSQRGHVHSLSSHGTGTTDPGGVLTRSTVDNGVHQHLERILKQN